MTVKPPNILESSEPAAPAHGANRSGAGDRYWALLPCAGSGSRAASAVPKQYQPIDGMPMVLHTLAAFVGVARIRHTLVVLAPDDRLFDALWAGRSAGVSSASCGADTRAGTVANGLAALRALGARDDDWVLVHDAARCLVTPGLIERLIDACRGDSVGGLLALRVSDTVKLARGDRVAATVDRSLHWLAQTPQMFRLGPLQQALVRAGPGVTDESSAVETLGQSPRLVIGDASNFKVTYPQDFLMAQALLQARRQVHPEERAHGQA